VSYEPALGPWDASRWLGLITHKWGREDKYNPDIDWVICGGESGPGARPMPPDWARSVRDQCQAAGVPFWFKQWGEYCWPAQMPEKTFRFVDAQYLAGMPEKPYRVGNKDAGCLLDGREWNELPNQVESTSQSVFTRMQSPLS
jgi:protein gp37